MRWKLILVTALVMQSSIVLAQVCPEPKQLDDVLDCLKTNHYLVQIKDYEVQNTENLGKAMGLTPNPVLDVQTVHSGNSRQTQIILAQQLDLAGRLKALRSQGSIIHNISKNSKAITQEEIVETVLLNIHHLIHLNQTLRVNNEVFNSLNSVIGTLRKRPVLNPDQEASLLNFDLQRSEVKTLIALLEDEEEQVLLFFYLNGGYRKDQILKVMEDHHHPLELIASSEGTSLNLMRLGLESKIAKEELTIQKAAVWDGISVGPMYMDDKLDSLGSKLYGVAFTMPIPVWQTNAPGKARAQISILNTQKQYDLFQRKESLEKKSLTTRISKLKTSLDQLPMQKELAQSHKRVEKLYSQGLISSTIYLDSHRIWRDVSASKLELEEKILRLTIEYYRLSGKLNEVHL